MNVAELKKLLENYPDDMEIVNGRYSDYQIISADEFSVIWGVDKKRVGYALPSDDECGEQNE